MHVQEVLAPFVTFLVTGSASDHERDTRDALAPKHAFGAQGNFRLPQSRRGLPDGNESGRRNVTRHLAIGADDTLGLGRNEGEIATALRTRERPRFHLGKLGRAGGALVE